MSYTVLARRYRSTDFGQVIGQEPIARTLQNAITTGRVAHAYLFTGTRGVGKTSMARLLACALNAPDSIPDCPKLPGEDQYPSKEVQDRMAQAIRRGDDLNVIEIDGASNRSVEEARQLIANAGLSPTGQALFKIYIIDEVHMLTREAFNALLKTMEEPPAHVKFILCTTEAHKVPATIQSRCQRFDFRAIPTVAIADHLSNVLKQEKVTADKQVVTQVAKLGNGSMRDALSLLDRLIAAAGEAPKGKKGPSLTAELLEQMLGLPDQEAVVSLVDALASGDVAGALGAAAALLNRGIGQEQFINVLIEYFRQMMLIGVCGVDSDLVELTDEARDKAAQQAHKFDTGGLVYMIALCENLQRSSRASSNPRALLDAAIVRLALAEKMADVAALLAGQAPAAITATTPPDASRKKKVTPPDPVKKNQLETPPPPPVVDTPVGQSEVWPTVLAAVREKPNMSWVRHLELRRLDDQAVCLALQPGHRDLAGFIDARRRRQLADLFQSVIGRPVRVELETTEAGAASKSEQASDNTASRASGTGTNPRRSVTQADRALAMEQPLVKLVMDTFDASVVGVYPEKQTPAED